MEEIVKKCEAAHDDRCRVCLQHTQNTIPIQNVTSIKEETSSFRDIIGLFSKIEDIITPQTICARCAEKAEASYEFKLLCEYSDKVLRNEIISKTIVINETNDFKIECPENELHDANLSEMSKATDMKTYSKESEVGNIAEEIIQSDSESVNAVSIEVETNFIELKPDLPPEDDDSFENEKKDDIKDDDSFENENKEDILNNIKDDDSFENENKEDILNDIKDDDFFENENREDILNAIKEDVLPINETNLIETKSDITSEDDSFETENKEDTLNDIKQDLQVCKYCDYKYHSKSMYRKHLHQFHKNKEEECEFCGNKYSSEYIYNHIRQKHGNERKYPDKCEICSFIFNSYSSYCEHMKTKHDTTIDLKVCDFCDFSTDSSFKLGNHKTLCHDDKKILQCSKCDKRFFTRRLLLIHIKGQHEETIRIVCEICGKFFKCKSTLEKHMFIHKGIKKYECKECGKRFRQNCTLNLHMLSHSDDRSHECKECNTMYKSNRALKQHVVAVHKKPKILKCVVCDKRFPDRTRLESHMFVHTKVKNYKCDECDKLFSWKSQLVQHQLVHTEKRHTCEICSKVFIVAQSLKRHLITHKK